MTMKPESAARELLQELLRDIKEVWVDTGFSGDIYHYHFKDTALAKVEVYAEQARREGMEFAADEILRQIALKIRWEDVKSVAHGDRTPFIEAMRAIRSAMDAAPPEENR